MDELLKELKEIKELLKNNNQNELLTIQQIHEQYEIGINTLRKIFRDPDLPVQKYTVPFKVTRKSFEEYLNKTHDLI